MGCFDRASPALKEILLKLHSVEKLVEIDYQLNEFGSVQYHIQGSSSSSSETEPRRHDIYLSVATSSLNYCISSSLQTTATSYYSTLLHVQLLRWYPKVEIVQPPKTGYQLTLRLDFNKFPESKEDCLKLITDISSLQAHILCSQLKEMFWFLSSQNRTLNGIYKPIKLVFASTEHFFVIRQPEKITVAFPMRFKDDSDVIIATTLFQELKVLGCSRAYAKAPLCTWSPIPPLELRGESFEDLSTNGGFMSFEILWRHIEGSRVDKTVWNLLNFYNYVNHYIKCTRGFIQRSMRKRVESLSEELLNSTITKNGNSEMKIIQGRKCMKKKKLIYFSKPNNILNKKCATFTKNIKRAYSKIKIHGLNQFIHRRCFKVPQFYSLRRYTKLED